MYAAGKIPGSFFRREGRPSEDAILTCRLIDRPLRPSFKKGLRNEIQVVATIMALNPDHLYDVVAINAASASTQLAGLPFSGPIGGVRVALINGQWVGVPDAHRARGRRLRHGRRRPRPGGRRRRDHDGRGRGHREDHPAGQGRRRGADRGGRRRRSGRREALHQGRSARPRPTSPPRPPSRPASSRSSSTTRTTSWRRSTAAVKGELAQALTIAGKQDREAELDRVKELAAEKLLPQFEGREKEISAAYRALTKKLVRERVIKDKVRIDGRGVTDIRTLAAEVEAIPRVHGSALFERGETQILGVTTLNMLRMEQQLDTLSPVTRKRYMHNYNFPPYSVGETGRVGSPKRREIGHGALAERAIVPVLPTREEFPYAIRQVSEALGSNGSTSMGSVCASTMSLLNAGVPLKAPVAGIAMGLISQEIDGKTHYVALTDILGAEDAFGDMDFKVAGTKEFVTALQLDTKLDGIPASVLAAALKQARDARLHILDVMMEAIDTPDEMSPNAPRIITVKIPVDKIGEVIGPKGKMINQIQEDTGAEITIEDDGTIYIGAPIGSQAEAARATINGIANPTMPEVGERYLGTVVKTTTFGAFVSLMPGKDGLLHISQIRKLAGGKRVENVEDVLGVGAKVQVEIAEIDSRGKLSLIPVIEGEDGRRGREGRRRQVTSRSSATTARPSSEGRAVARTQTLLKGQNGIGTVRRTTLPGGLRVVTETLPSVRSATFGIWVQVGSRDETPTLNGATHYLEHLLFKGTKQRSALDISSALDAVGGEMNAFTAKEYTCYYARVLDTDLPLAIDVVCDMLTGLADPRRGRRRRARRHPRRDRDDRGRPGRLRARPVRAHHARRHPPRPPGPRHRRHHQRARPQAQISRFYKKHYDPTPPGRRGRRKRRPRHRRTPGPQGLREGRRPVPHGRGPGRPARRRPRPEGRRAGWNCSTAAPNRRMSSSACRAWPAPTSAAGRSEC